MPDSGDLAAASSPERAAELRLVRACAAGDGPALRALEAEFFAEVRACHARLRPADLGVDELEQRVRDKLFVRGAIARFSGKGDLRRWLRVLTTRLIVDHVRARRPALPLEDELLPDTHGAGADTALAKDQLRVQVRGALRRAFAALSDRQQLLLRAELHGTTLAALAATYQVHVRSMQRWVREAHQVLAVVNHLPVRNGGRPAVV